MGPCARHPDVERAKGQHLVAVLDGAADHAHLAAAAQAFLAVAGDGEAGAARLQHRARRGDELQPARLRVGDGIPLMPLAQLDVDGLGSDHPQRVLAGSRRNHLDQPQPVVGAVDRRAHAGRAGTHEHDVPRGRLAAAL